MKQTSAAKHLAELKRIRVRIVETAATIASIKERHDEYLIASAAGDGAAIRQIDAMRAAEAEHGELLKVEPLALQRVEEDERQARSEMLKARKQHLAADRIAAAEQITRALAEAQAAFEQFKALGQELLGIAITPGAGSMSQAEDHRPCSHPRRFTEDVARIVSGVSPARAEVFVAACPKRARALVPAWRTGGVNLKTATEGMMRKRCVAKPGGVGN
jgi:hypothetical protein